MFSCCSDSFTLLFFLIAHSALHFWSHLCLAPTSRPSSHRTKSSVHRQFSNSLR
uniref:Uncharacterized protein n=1 Tax=Lates calcarifer TaxID=8187 RepID=A0A4W6CPM7_LATCA